MLKHPLPNEFSRFYPPYLIGRRGMRKQRKIGIKRRKKTNLKAENRRQMYLTQKDITSRVPIGQVRRDFVSVHQQALFNQLRDKAEETRKDAEQKKILEIEDRKNQQRQLELGKRRLIQDKQIAENKQKQLSIQNAIRVDENKARLREMDAQQHFQQQQLRLASDFMRDISAQLQSSERRQGELEAKVQSGLNALRNRTGQDIPIQYFQQPKPFELDAPALTLQRQRTSEVQQELALQRSIGSTLSRESSTSSTGSAYGVKPKRRPQAPSEDPNIVALRRRRQEEREEAQQSSIRRLLPPPNFEETQPPPQPSPRPQQPPPIEPEPEEPAPAPTLPPRPIASRRGSGRGQGVPREEPIQPLLQDTPPGAGVGLQEEEVIEQGLSRKDIRDRLSSYEKLINLNKSGGLTARGGRTAKTDVFFEITEDLPTNWYFDNRGNIPNKRGKYKLNAYGDGTKTGNARSFTFQHNREFFSPRGTTNNFNFPLYEEGRDKAFRKAIEEGKIKFSGDIPE